MSAVHRPTLHDVARAAGVSHQTVSRVLNGTGYTSAAARERVLSAVAAVGYRRNAIARALVTNRSSTIGLLMPTESGSGVQVKAAAVEVAARAAGYATVVTTADPDDPDSLRTGLERLLDQPIAGLVIVIGHERARTLITPPMGIPRVVMTSEVLEEAPLDADEEVEERGARLAVQHLVDLGHRRILHLAGPDGWISAATRRRAYQHVLRAAGLEPMTPVTAGWTADGGYRAASTAVPSRGATAIFAANDQVALGAVRACLDLQLRVPGDVSVIGYDDLPQSAYTSPSITSIAKHEDELGQRAFDLLLRRIEGHQDAVSLTDPVDPELKQRESTAPAPCHPSRKAVDSSPGASADRRRSADLSRPDSEASGFGNP